MGGQSGSEFYSDWRRRELGSELVVEEKKKISKTLRLLETISCPKHFFDKAHFLKPSLGINLTS
jgi:hypothetical protein